MDMIFIFDCVILQTSHRLQCQHGISNEWANVALAQENSIRTQAVADLGEGAPRPPPPHLSSRSGSATVKV